MNETDFVIMHKMFIIVFMFWGIFSILVHGKRIPSFAGPYKVIIRKIGNETEEFNSIGKFWCRMYGTHPKLNEKQYMWGQCFNEMGLSDEYKIDARMSQWSNNQWKRNAFVFKLDKACSSSLFHAKAIVDLLLEPTERKCPLPKYGMRKIANQSFEAVYPQFPIMPYGRYRFTAAYIKSGITDGLIVAEVDLVPKL